MKMGLKKLSSILILLVLMVMPMVLALDTVITVKTKPGYSVNVRISDIELGGTLENGAFLDQIADENGKITVTYSSDTINKIDFTLMIKNNGNAIQFAEGPVYKEDNNGEHIKTGWPVEIDTTVNPPVLIKSGKPAEEVIEDISETTNSGNVDVNIDVVNDSVEPELEKSIEEIEPETTAGITGKAIGVGKSIFSSKITYFVGILLIVIFVVIFIAKKNLDSNDKKEKPFEIKKEGDKKENPTQSMTGPEELADAEKKLEEARIELEEVRVKDQKEEQIRAAKARFDRDKAALDELEKQ